MKNTRAIVMLVIAVLLGLVAVGIAVQWLGDKRGVGQKVAVATRDLQPGTELTASAVTTIDWPAGETPSGAFNNPAELEGRVLKTVMARGEPVLESKLAPVGTKGGLSSVIDPGKRAITVRVNEVVGVAGFALPGNYVDILVNTQDEQQKPVSKIVLEKILVLAVAQEATRDETKPKVVDAVTLEVTPDEAEILDLARSIGNLLGVVNLQLDQETIQTVGARRRDLLDLKESVDTVAPAAKPVVKRVAARSRPKPAAKPLSQSEKVEIIKGLNRSNAEF
jgi:pilus assembly protein CpaB